MLNSIHGFERKRTETTDEYDNPFSAVVSECMHHGEVNSDSKDQKWAIMLI